MLICASFNKQKQQKGKMRHLTNVHLNEYKQLQNKK